MVFSMNLMIAGLVAACFALGPQDEKGQEAARDSRSEARADVQAKETYVAVKAVDLAHMRAEDVVRAIEALQLPVRAYPIGERTVLISGPFKEVKRMTEYTIGLMDAPGAPSGTNVAPVTIPLGSLSTGNLWSALQAVISHPATMFAIDRGNNALVVRGTPEDVEAVRALVDSLRSQRAARPAGTPESFTVYFYFLRCAVVPRDGAGVQVPAHLASVGKALTEAGFGDVELMSAHLVRAAHDGNFALGSAFRWSMEKDDSVVQPNVSSQLSGRLRSQPNENAVQLSLRGSLRASLAESDSKRGWTELFGLETTIAVKTGSFAIVGATPTATEAGDSIALAVRVTAE